MYVLSLLTGAAGGGLLGTGQYAMGVFMLLVSLGLFIGNELEQ